MAGHEAGEGLMTLDGEYAAATPQLMARAAEYEAPATRPSTSPSRSSTSPCAPATPICSAKTFRTFAGTSFRPTEGSGGIRSCFLTRRRWRFRISASSQHPVWLALAIAVDQQRHAPQPEQNFAPTGFVFWHLGHAISVPVCAIADAIVAGAPPPAARSPSY